MNNNFKIILDNNKEFISCIKKLLEKNLTDIRTISKDIDNFRKDLKDGKLMKFFSSVYVGDEDLLYQEKNSCVVLNEKNGNKWYFSCENLSFELKQIRRSLKDQKFYITHNKERSFAEENIWQNRDFIIIEFNGTSISQEDIDLTKIVHDRNIDFLKIIKIEDFNLKNKTTFVQNFEKNFGEKTYLFKNKRK